MRPACLLAFIIAADLAAEGSMLLDDFSSGDGQNQLGQSWYYFSDENDDGNSVICNAEHKAGGGYSGIVYDTVSDTTNLCGKIEFVFGDKMCSYCMSPFVGIGTDLAAPGRAVDLTGMFAVRFRARSVPACNCFFEIVSDNISGFSYYRQSFYTTPAWTEFLIYVNDLEQPGWTKARDEVRLEDALACIRKFNWQITKSINGFDTVGCLMIDIVIIQGIDSLPEEIPTSLSEKRMVVRPSGVGGAVTMYDLLGREFDKGIGGYTTLPGAFIGKMPGGIRVRIDP